MELDVIAILNLMVFLLFLGVLVLLCHLVLSLLKSKAKEAARVGTTTNCWLQRRQILPMAKRVKMSLFDFSKRKCWLFSFLKQQIQRRTSLGPNSQRRRGPFGSEQGRDILFARGICLHMQEKGPISCLMPARRPRNGLPKGFSLVQSSSSSHCFPKIRANPITNASQSLDNLIPDFCPSDSWAKIHMSVSSKSVPNGALSTRCWYARRPHSKPSLGWMKKQTAAQAKCLPNLYKRCQATPVAAPANNKNTSGHTKPTFARGPHAKPSYLRPKKSPKHGKSCTPYIHHHHTTTSGNTKSMFCLEKFQS